MAESKLKLPYNDLSIFQKESGHSCTTDTEFLVNTVLHDSTHSANRPLKVLEVGTGSGIIAIMLALARKKWKVTAVEVQIPLYHMALKNIKRAEVEIDLKLADIRKYQAFFWGETFDLILANPPYYKAGSGKLAKDNNKNFSRFEFLCDMNDLFCSISNTLKNGGSAYVLYPTKRTKEIIRRAHEHNLYLINSIKVDINQLNKSRQQPLLPQDVNVIKRDDELNDKLTSDDAFNTSLKNHSSKSLFILSKG